MSHLGRPVLSQSLELEPRRLDAPASSARTPWGFGICLGFGLVFWLWAASNLGNPLLPILFAAAVLFVLGIWWCVLVVVALVRKQRPSLVLLIAPIAVLAVVALGFTTVPMKARWLVSEPGFTTIIRLSEPSTVQPPDPADEEAGWSALEPCPPVIGLYSIRSCERFPAGYLFFDSAGSGLIDDGGVAYLPDGVPADAGTGWFESPEFIHLHGDWYSFASSW